MGTSLTQLGVLRQQTDSLRADLGRLQSGADELKVGAVEEGAARVVEINEELMRAALRLQRVAEVAVSYLGELTWSSQRDVLTHIPNRALMLDRINNAIALARRHGTRFALLFLDVDHFKQINDRFGHAIGDAALQLLARRLQSMVRDSDTVCRYGGDEFLVLLPEIVHPSDAATVAAKVLSAIAEPALLGKQVLRLSTSIGVSIYPEEGGDAASLIAHADSAMYRAKRQRQASGVRRAGNLIDDIGPDAVRLRAFTPVV